MKGRVCSGKGAETVRDGDGILAITWGPTFFLWKKNTITESRMGKGARRKENPDWMLRTEGKFGGVKMFSSLPVLRSSNPPQFN